MENIKLTHANTTSHTRTHPSCPRACLVLVHAAPAIQFDREREGVREREQYSCEFVNGGHLHLHVTTGNDVADQLHAPASHAAGRAKCHGHSRPCLAPAVMVRESTLFGQARCASQVKNRLTRS
jgi:hypothetical protein